MAGKERTVSDEVSNTIVIGSDLRVTESDVIVIGGWLGSTLQKKITSEEHRMLMEILNRPNIESTKIMEVGQLCSCGNHNPTSIAFCGFCGSRLGKNEYKGFSEYECERIVEDLRQTIRFNEDSIQRLQSKHDAEIKPLLTQRSELDKRLRDAWAAKDYAKKHLNKRKE